ncbi:hypothetical protein [Micromonospora sp. PLK6-60]|uniref:YqeB family protein n=1 Tax=Micromonospora sp. PLK6-60 TaxID=2873383 RepID=UPI0027DFD4CD|nr:hypothetical protein [Micromonospora sp. PLK6-60]
MSTPGGDDAVTVAGGAAELAVLWGGFPLLGAGVGWLFATVAPWVATELRWVPFRGLFKAVAELPDRTALIGAVAVGVLAGVAVAAAGHRDRLTVSVERHRVRMRRAGQVQEFPRTAVRAAFLDGTALVLLGAREQELVRERADLDGARLAAAFRRHGVPWTDGDPHRDAYRRWVAGLPGLPAGADVLLGARQRAVERDRRGEARELRGELARLGVVVRDDDKRQYWRLSGTAATDGES